MCVYADLEPVRGSEQGGRRPVLVVSHDEFNAVVSNVTIVPLTSTSRSLYPCEVRMSKGVAGLSADSILMAHQVRTIAQERLGRILGRLDDLALQQQIDQALKDHLDLP